MRGIPLIRYAIIPEKASFVIKVLSVILSEAKNPRQTLRSAQGDDTESSF